MKLTFHGHRPTWFQTQAGRNQCLDAVSTPTAPASIPTNRARQTTGIPVKKINMGFFKIKIHPSAAQKSSGVKPSPLQGQIVEQKDSSTNEPTLSDREPHTPLQEQANSAYKPEVQQQPTEPTFEECQKIIKDLKVGTNEHFAMNADSIQKLEAWTARTSTLATICLRNAHTLRLTNDDIENLKFYYKKPTPKDNPSEPPKNANENRGLERHNSMASTSSEGTDNENCTGSSLSGYSPSLESMAASQEPQTASQVQANRDDNSQPPKQPTYPLDKETIEIISDFESGKNELSAENASDEQKLEVWKTRTSLLAIICERNPQILKLTYDDFKKMKVNDQQPIPKVPTPAARQITEGTWLYLERQDSTLSELTEIAYDEQSTVPKRALTSLSPEANADSFSVSESEAGYPWDFVQTHDLPGGVWERLAI